MKNIYKEGWNAQQNGLRFNENPYAYNSIDRTMWDEGWVDAFKEKEN